MWEFPRGKAKHEILKGAVWLAKMSVQDKEGREAVREVGGRGGELLFSTGEKVGNRAWTERAEGMRSDSGMSAFVTREHPLKPAVSDDGRL